MAELAVDRASSPEVLELAEEVSAAQQPEIDTMSGWLEEWGEPVPDDMGDGSGDMGGMPGMLTDEQLADLEAADGPAFDQMFLEAMIDHHTGAIQMAQTEQENGAAPEAIELAEEIEQAQTEEIDRMAVELTLLLVYPYNISGSSRRSANPRGKMPLGAGTGRESPMSVASQMLDTYPRDLGGIDKDQLRACIEACLECTQACTACADACLGEDMVAELTKCIRINLDCADVCDTTGRVLSRHTGYDANLTRSVLEVCAVACKACGDECTQHAEMHEHCRVCAEVCRRCEDACRELIAGLG